MGRSLIPSLLSVPEVSRKNDIPIYAADGTPLGFRSPEAAQRLLANGYVKPSYGRRAQLRALWLLKEDGRNPVETRVRSGTRYSFVQRLDNGHRCWKLRRVDGKDDDGTPVSTRGAFLQVVKDCLGPWRRVSQGTKKADHYKTLMRAKSFAPTGPGDS